MCDARFCALAGMPQPAFRGWVAMPPRFSGRSRSCRDSKIAHSATGPSCFVQGVADVSVTPDNLPRSYPEVRFASFAQPYRRMQGHMPARINRNIPARFHLLEQHHLQPLPASTWTPHAHRPLFIAVARQDEIPARQLRRQHVAVDDKNGTSGQKGGDESAPPQGSAFHATLLCGASAGSPSSGSVAPVATGNRLPAVNRLSANVSSSPSASMKIERASASFGN